MPTTPRAAVEAAARTLVESLAALKTPPTVRVADAEDGVACLVLVWDARQAMPTVRWRSPGGRLGCKADVLDVIAAAGRSVTRKEVVKALKAAGKKHGPGTVAKALADLTAAGELVNPRDKKGYRLPAWRRDRTPSLFD
ncbi:unnamed protein product [Gemmataceae bacterium]|nr:unnamed protein product [Gemmataceae bacterium]VTU00905.1 unnamed protein product [Gemmataceae bacterium]